MPFTHLARDFAKLSPGGEDFGGMDQTEDRCWCCFLVPLGKTFWKASTQYDTRQLVEIRDEAIAWMLLTRYLKSENMSHSVDT